MELKDLEYYLEQGKSLGFVKPAAPGYIGWISLEKRKVDERLLALFNSDEMPSVVNEQMLNEKSPYVVRVSELKKEVYESDDYSQNDDYRINEIHRFANMNEVIDFIATWNLNIRDIKWLSEIPSE